MTDNPTNPGFPSPAPSTKQLRTLGMTLSIVAQNVTAYLVRPDVQARLRDAALFLRDVSERVRAIDSPGYAPYFERLGQDAFTARLYAGFVRHLATRLYVENRNKRIVLSAIHHLARSARWHPGLMRQVGRLYDAVPNGGVIENGLRKAGRPDFEAEFPILLQRAHNGDHAMSARLIVIATAIVPHVPSARGRPLTMKSALHQAFLRWSSEIGGRGTYTYGPVPGSTDPNSKEDFTDVATAATRIELRQPRFSPVSAWRAERKRRERREQAETPVSKA